MTIPSFITNRAIAGKPAPLFLPRDTTSVEPTLVWDTFTDDDGHAWRTVAKFRVFGTPKAQPRPRAFAKKFGDVYSARIYDAGTAEGWKGEIALHAREHRPAVAMVGPIRVDIVFLFARPGRLDRKKDPAERIMHDAKPDRDNLDKACLDCLTTLGFWEDDGQVCAGEVRKFYVAKGELPGAEIQISIPVADRSTTQLTHIDSDAPATRMEECK